MRPRHEGFDRADFGRPCSDAEIRDADLFFADLLGQDSPIRSESIPYPEYASVEYWRDEAREPFFGDNPHEHWKVIARPGSKVVDELRDDDLVVYRSFRIRGSAWKCILIRDLNRGSLFQSGTVYLRHNIAVLRRMALDPSTRPDAGVQVSDSDFKTFEARSGSPFEASGLSEDQQPAPSQPASSVCAQDVAVTDEMALLFASRAPLAVTSSEIARVSNDSGAQQDYHAVATFVPASAERRLLLFFHGNNNYVTLAPSGDVPRSVDPSGHSRVPRWADAQARSGALATKSALSKYGLNALRSAQGALAPRVRLLDSSVRDPVVLVPEDGERTTGRFWSVPPIGQYGTSNDGRPNGPGTTRLQDLVMECYEHLRCLRNPSGRKYLSNEMSNRASWVGNIQRIYLSGHSGGGKPLVEAAGADMALITPSSVVGVGGRAVEFWLFDCTYGFGTHNYVNLCANWRNAGLLNYRNDSARFVCVYRPREPNSNTETEADNLRGRIAATLNLSAGSLLKLHDSADMASASMIRDVIPALMSSPVVFIRTLVGHDQIPTRFTPLLLLTAAS